MPRGGYNPGDPYSKVDMNGNRRTVTATFNYGGELHTLVAQTRKDAFAAAERRWGLGWDGEPVISSPASIYRDLIGNTKLDHGQDLASKDSNTTKRDRFRRTGASYGDARR